MAEQGKRDLGCCPHCGSRNLTLFARIVGYYSRVDNWNPSKLSELDDRHKGDYAVGEAPDEGKEETER